MELYGCLNWLMGSQWPCSMPMPFEYFFLDFVVFIIFVNYSKFCLIMQFSIKYVYEFCFSHIIKHDTKKTHQIVYFYIDSVSNAQQTK